MKIIANFLSMIAFFSFSEHLFQFLGCAEFLQGAVKSLQLFPHLAQGILNLLRLIQNLNAAGKWVIANPKGALDGRWVSPNGGWIKMRVCSSSSFSNTVAMNDRGLTSTYSWRPRSSQTQSRRAGRFGPGTAALHTLLVQMAGTLAG